MTTPLQHLGRSRSAAARWPALAVLLLGACDNTVSRADALSQAGAATCGYYQRCNLIGNPGQFESVEACQQAEVAAFDKYWKPGCVIGKYYLEKCISVSEQAVCDDQEAALAVLFTCNSICIL